MPVKTGDNLSRLLGVLAALLGVYTLVDGKSESTGASKQFQVNVDKQNDKTDARMNFFREAMRTDRAQMQAEVAELRRDITADYRHEVELGCKCGGRR